MKEHAREGRRASRHRIFLVEDHPVLREGFAQLLSRQPDFQICGQADSAETALAQLDGTRPELIVVDIELKGCNGIELIKQVKALWPKTKFLVLSMHDEALYAERALRAGAQGYVMKQATVDEVIKAIRQVLRDEQYLSAKMQERILNPFRTREDVPLTPILGQLSDRELEVFHMIGRGARTREIAKKLQLSVKTIETYRAHIIEKLKLQDGLELARYAIRVVNEEQKRTGVAG